MKDHQRSPENEQFIRKGIYMSSSESDDDADENYKENENVSEEEEEEITIKEDDDDIYKTPKRRYKRKKKKSSRMYTNSEDEELINTVTKCRSTHQNLWTTVAELHSKDRTPKSLKNRFTRILAPRIGQISEQRKKRLEEQERKKQQEEHNAKMEKRRKEFEEVRDSILDTTHLVDNMQYNVYGNQREQSSDDEQQELEEKRKELKKEKQDNHKEVSYQDEEDSDKEQMKRVRKGKQRVSPISPQSYSKRRRISDNNNESRLSAVVKDLRKRTNQPLKIVLYALYVCSGNVDIAYRYLMGEQTEMDEKHIWNKEDDICLCQDHESSSELDIAMEYLQMKHDDLNDRLTFLERPFE